MKTKLAPMQRVRTSDPVETAYYLTKGYELTRCDVEEIPHITFTVKGRALEQESEQFHSHETRVEPLQFSNELTLVHESTLAAIEKYKEMQRKESDEND